MGQDRFFRVCVAGENLLKRMEPTGQVAPFGFYTNRWVAAADAATASEDALRLIRLELGPQSLNSESDPYRLLVETVEELQSLSGIETPGRGFTFYLEGV